MSDVRIEKIEQKVDGIQADVSEIKVKIFNGFDKSITNTEEKIHYIDQLNTKEHETIIKNIDKLSGKFDKMIWLWLSGSVTIVIGVIIFVIKGSV